MAAHPRHFLHHSAAKSLSYTSKHADVLTSTTCGGAAGTLESGQPHAEVTFSLHPGDNGFKNGTYYLEVLCSPIPVTGSGMPWFAGGGWASNSTCEKDTAFRVGWNYRRHAITSVSPSASLALCTVSLVAVVCRVAFPQGKQSSFKSLEDSQGKVRIPGTDAVNSRQFSMSFWIKNEGCSLNQFEGFIRPSPHSTQHTPSLTL